MFFKLGLLLRSIPLALGKVQFMGMNIAGLDFGCAIDGTCPISSAQIPLSTLGGGDGLGQMQHFVADNQMNIFRLPVSWQYLVNNQLGGTLDSRNFGKYDQLMQACLSTSETTFCAIDIHNFARWNGAIIGQSSGVTNDQFTSLWTQLAIKYASSTRVVFGIMNEPHDLDVPTWANTVQLAVTAIRNAGASSQMILMPGTNFASAGQFVSSGSADALLNVTNPDGTTAALVYDLHKYLDVDNSGTHADCTTDNIEDAFAIAAAYLRWKGRFGLVSETGAGSTSSCFTDFCAQNTFLNQNSDVFLGYIAWAAGSFSTSYLLSLTPSKSNGKYVDNALASQCVVSPWLNAGTAIVTSPIPSAIGSSAATSVGAIVIGAPSSAAASTTDASGSSPSTVATEASTLATSTSSVTPAGNFSASAAPTTSSASTATQVVSTGGAEMKQYAGGLLAGSLFVALIL
ncbi:cellulase-domain-containing protein [Mollisia scopiformis]|uniref:Endoglucanase EG-II n=1 Tax=Mollisia scopiformis TaxID=149040 RepID=A0A194X8X7_MOLSC|nr:cellulase-domain-containing protein [Mollisia scopiformis]KUJ16625.1 cellulase-domain-containing protein [Mollisia scopiformis]